MQPSLLRTERKRRGWSQNKLAEKVGVNISTVSRWEQGLTVPYPYYRKKLTALFGKTADELGLLPHADEQEETALIAVQSETAPQACLLADPTKPEALDNATSLLEPDVVLQAGKDSLRPRSLWEGHLGSLNRVVRFGLPNRVWRPLILLSILLGTVLLIVVAVPVFHWQFSPRTAQAPNHDGTCELAWMGQGVSGGSGSTDLDVSHVRDLGLRQALRSEDTKGRTAHPSGYHLLCGLSLHLQSCSLVQSGSNQGTNGNPDLDVENSVISSYIHDTLLNQYSLQCKKNGKSSTNVVTSRPVATSAPVASIPRRSYEAESPQNTLGGGARVISCARCSGGYRVGYLGLRPNGKSGNLCFNNIKKDIAGNYMMTIHYTEGYAGDWTGYISVNGGPALFFIGKSTGTFKTAATVDMVVRLNRGNNSIEFFNPHDKAPDIDSIVV